MVVFLLTLTLLTWSSPAHSSLLGEDELRAQGWKEGHAGVWTRSDDISSYLERCRKDQDSTASIELPILVQGVHEIYLDGRRIAASGDRTFQEASSIYASLLIRCQDIKSGQRLEWKRYTATPLVAHSGSQIKFTHGTNWSQFFNETLSIIGMGGLLFVLLILMVFRKSIPSKILFFNFITAMSFAVFLAFLTPEYLPWRLPSAVTQKLSDSGIWIGLGGLFVIFYAMNLTNRALMRMGVISMALSTLGVVLAPNQNVGQFISNLAMIVVWVPMFGTTARNVILALRDPKRKTSLLIENIPLVILLLTASNDTLLFFIAGPITPIFPIGLIAAYMLLVLFISDKMRSLSDQEQRLKELVVDLDLINQSLTQARELQEENFHSEYARTIAEWAQKLQKELREKQDWILTLSRDATRGALTDQVIHDLKSPVSALQMLGRYLELKPIEEQVFRGALERLIDVTSSLRKSEAHGVKQLSNLRDSLRPVLVESRWLAKHHGLDLEWIWPEQDSDLPVLIEHGLLARSIENLVRNSIESIEERRKSIIPCETESSKRDRVRVELVRSGDRIEVRVSDTGVGFGTSNLESQEKPGLRFSTKGSSGIGLSVVKDFCAKYSGKFSFSELPRDGFAAEAQLEVQAG